MANERNEIESGLETVLATVPGLATVMSIGAQDYETVLKAALAKAPFAVIKYLGKSGDMLQGGLMRWTAEISVLVGAKSFKSINAQRQTMFDLLDAMEIAAVGKRLSSADGDDVYWPLVLVAEQWSELSGTGLEVWEQRYAIQWESIPANQ